MNAEVCHIASEILRISISRLRFIEKSLKLNVSEILSAYTVKVSGITDLNLLTHLDTHLSDLLSNQVESKHSSSLFAHLAFISTPSCNIHAQSFLEALSFC